jgi:hypothetical protein
MMSIKRFEKGFWMLQKSKDLNLKSTSMPTPTSFLQED